MTDRRRTCTTDTKTKTRAEAVAAAAKYAAGHCDLAWEDVEKRLAAGLKRHGLPLDELTDGERLAIFEAHLCPPATEVELQVRIAEAYEEAA